MIFNGSIVADNLSRGYCWGKTSINKFFTFVSLNSKIRGEIIGNIISMLVFSSSIRYS